MAKEIKIICQDCGGTELDHACFECGREIPVLTCAHNGGVCAECRESEVLGFDVQEDLHKFING